MLKKLFSSLIDNDLYIQAWEHRVQIRNLQTGEEVSEEPFIAIKKDQVDFKKIEAIGYPAKSLMHQADMDVSNPFSHPRLLIANFPKAEKVIQRLVQQLCRKKLFAVSPRIIFQPMDKLEGGITDVEIRVFRELCLGAGAREVVIYLGPPSLVAGMKYDEIKMKGL